VISIKGIKVRSCFSLAMWLLVMSIGLPAVYAASQNLVLVEGGSFYMGDKPSCAIRSEQLVRQVTVNSFYINKYEVTFEEYDEFCHDTGRNKPKDFNWGRGLQPVVGVTWYDAVQYCNWLSRKERITPAYSEQDNSIICDFNTSGYRLPTEAEWEYAAKGGMQSHGYKYSGSNDMSEVAWYKYNSCHRTQPIGQKRPNELGVYDMSGNAWEWCWDWYDRNYYAHGDNPTGPLSGSFHSIRGGDMNFYACGLDYRFNYAVSSRITYIGFRLARSVK